MLDIIIFENYYIVQLRLYVVDGIDSGLECTELEVVLYNIYYIINVFLGKIY